jgi:PadR family transcriptional regulator
MVSMLTLRRTAEFHLEPTLLSQGSRAGCLPSKREVSYIDLRWEAALPRQTIDLIQGTLDLLVLQTLSWGPAHGYAIARWIEQLTGDVLQVGEGSLYPALHRLEEREWIEAEWRLSENNRRAKFYQLTPLGRRQLRKETLGWGLLVEAVGKVLKTREKPT